MSLVPKISRFMDNTPNYGALGSLIGDTGVQREVADIKGDLQIGRAEALGRARIFAGEQALKSGQDAGSSATTMGAINGVTSAVMGGVKGHFSNNQGLGSDPFRDPSPSDYLTNDVDRAYDWSQSGGDNYTYWDSDMDNGTSILRSF